MTRHGLVAAVILASLAAAACHTPTEPAAPENPLAGSWSGSSIVAPCADGRREDWSSASLILRQNGTEVSGEVFAPQGKHFPVSSSGPDILNVGGLDNMNCTFFHFAIMNRTFDSAGNLRRFTGIAEGRCCGTTQGTFSFERQ